MKSLLKLRELAAQLPQTPSGESLITARAVEELTGFPSGNIYAAMSRGLIRAKIRLASTILFSVEDIISTFGKIKPRKGGYEL